MKKRQYFKLYFIILWMFIIFNFSAQNSDKSLNTSNEIIINTAEIIQQEKLTETEKTNIIEKYLVIVRKSAHFFIYFILGILVVTFLKDFYGLSPTTLIFTIIFCFIYACSDEIHQLFINGRSCQFTDVLIDTSGSFLSSSITLLILSLSNKKLLK